MAINSLNNVVVAKGPQNQKRNIYSVNTQTCLASCANYNGQW